MKSGLRVRLRRRKGAVGDAAALYDDVWSLFEKNIHSACSYRAGSRSIEKKRYGLVLAHYLGTCKPDGGASATELRFVFSDGAGTSSLSSEAAHHWFSLLRAALHADLVKLAGFRGFDLADEPPALAPLLARAETPLVGVGDVLCGVASSAKNGASLFSDDGVKPPALAKLAAKDRARIDAIATTGACACAVCERLRDERPFLWRASIAGGRVRLVGKHVSARK